MAVKDGMTRVTVSFNEETIEKIDMLANMQGTNRSAVINVLVSASLDSYIQMWQMISNPSGLSDLMKLAQSVGATSTVNEIQGLQSDIEKLSSQKKDNLVKTSKALNKKKK